MTWLKGSEFINTPTAPNMWDIGTKTNNMASAKKNGMMEVNTKAFIKMPQKKAKVNIAGLMAIDMWVSGKIICSTEEVYSCGTMTDYSSESGKTT